MKIKKSLFSLSLIFIAFVSCSTIDKNLNLKKPTANIDKISINSISMNDIVLQLDLSVSNPYPVSINVEKILFNVLAENTPLTKGESESTLSLKANSSSPTNFLVKINYSDINKIYNDYLNRDYITLTINTDLTLKLPEFPGVPSSYTLPIVINKKIPAIKFDMDISNFELQTPSIKEITASLKANGASQMTTLEAVKYISDLINGRQFNPADIPKGLDLYFNLNCNLNIHSLSPTTVQIKQVNYNLIVNEVPFATGTGTEINSTGKDSFVKIQTTVPINKLKESTSKIFSTSKAKYHVTGSAIIVLSDPDFNQPIKVNFEKQGETTVSQ